MESEPGNAVFHTTRWSLVQAAGADGAEARAALEALCRSYWYPLYAYARRRGQARHDAEDLVQRFFGARLQKVSSPSCLPNSSNNFLLSSLAICSVDLLVSIPNSAARFLNFSISNIP